MDTPKVSDKAALKLDDKQCSQCTICYSLCPYGAVKRDEPTGKTVLDIEKCQVCGICYSNCPTKAYDIAYYDFDSLIHYIEEAREKYKSNDLVIMCKGSAPDFSGIEKLSGLSNFIPLSVPCVGRIPFEVFVRLSQNAIDKVFVLACDEDYCRFERGSKLTERRIILLNSIQEQFGKEPIVYKKNTLKVKVDADLCIHCGNCVWYCPYHAASLDSTTVHFDLNKCRGCGLCMAMCPACALDLEHWEDSTLKTLVTDAANSIKGSPKIMVFRCQWAAFPTLNGDKPENVSIIDLPCASRVDPMHVLTAFQNGIDGVLIASCSEEDCKQEKAGGKARVTAEKLKKRLEQIGMGDRLHFITAAPRYPERFDAELQNFSRKITGLTAKEKV